MSKLEIRQAMGRGKVLQQEDSLGTGLVTQEPWVGFSQKCNGKPLKNLNQRSKKLILEKKCLVPHTETEIQTKTCLQMLSRSNPQNLFPITNSAIYSSSHLLALFSF